MGDFYGQVVCREQRTDREHEKVSGYGGDYFHGLFFHEVYKSHCVSFYYCVFAGGTVKSVSPETSPENKGAQGHFSGADSFCHLSAYFSAGMDLSVGIGDRGQQDHCTDAGLSGRVVRSAWKLL